MLANVKILKIDIYFLESKQENKTEQIMQAKC